MPSREKSLIADIMGYAVSLRGGLLFLCGRFPMRTSRFATVAVLLLACAGCSSTYYSAWEKAGYHKRDILVSRVQKARDGQQAAKEQFQTTLDHFKAVTGFQGGNLEAKYKALSAE